MTVSLRDRNGNDDRQATNSVHVEVKGAGYLAGYGNADPNTDRSFKKQKWPMYDGYVQAAVRTTCEEGKIYVMFQAEGYESVTVILQSVKTKRLYVD
ncbi:MAG: hypothetical protein NC489_29420 [Ruminococcus flavefaciens]|nr:hypothetical protein [Ruminococcus flavefaciens]